MKKIFKLIPLISLFGLASCDPNITTYSYENPELYTVGDVETTDNVNKLSINYLLGNIKVDYSKDEKFRIIETTDKSVSDDVKIRTYLDETGLMTIQPCKSGKIEYGKAKRTLTIEVPTTYSLTDISLNTVTVTQSINVDATSYHVDTVTGDTIIETRDFETIEVDVVTGNVNITIDNDFDVALDYSSVTGSYDGTVNTSLDSVHKIEVNSVTGNLSVNYK